MMVGFEFADLRRLRLAGPASIKISYIGTQHWLECGIRLCSSVASRRPLAYSASDDCSTGTPGPIVEDTEIFLR